MMMYRPPCRFRTKGLVRRAPLWPQVEPGTLPKVQRRLDALEEVLCRLPPEPYAALGRSPPQFCWAPSNGAVLGRTRQVLTDESVSGDNRGLYYVELAPSLEREAWPIIVTVVVHELAHVLLGHVEVSGGPGFDRQEIEAWNSLRVWGFQAEGDYAGFLLRHQTSALEGAC
jgi:hypothetical protein